jgi:type I restriction enzyme S subunit
LTYSPLDVCEDGDNEGTIVLRSSNIKNGSLNLNDIVRVKIPISEKLQVNINDIIICARNGSKKLVGKSALIEEISEPMTFGAFMAICKTSLYEYIYLFLQSELFFSQLRKVSDTTTINQLTQNNFNNFLVPIPPYCEQRKIIKKFQELSPVIDRYNSVYERAYKIESTLFDILKKSILQYAIQGKLVPQIDTEEPATILLEQIRAEKLRLLKEGKLKKKDIKESVIFKDDDNRYYEKVGKVITDITEDLPFEIPESWQWSRLSSIANLYTGNSINEAEKNARYTNVQGTEYIATKDVKFDNSIDYQNGVAIPNQYVANFRIAPAKSVLMCIEGGSAGRKIGILDQEVCFGNKLCCFAPYTDISEYIFYYLQSPLFFEIFSSNKNGIIGGVSVNNLKQLFIPLPPQDEITRIVNKIRAILKSIEG